jgi:hypothetical protein
MKRLLVLLAIVGLVVALPLSHVVFAKGDKSRAKVKICFVNPENDVILFGGGMVVFGNVIRVLKKTVPAYEAYEASTDFELMDEDLRDDIEELRGINLRDADCNFIVPNRDIPTT